MPFKRTDNGDQCKSGPLQKHNIHDVLIEVSVILLF